MTTRTTFVSLAAIVMSLPGSILVGDISLVSGHSGGVGDGAAVDVPSAGVWNTEDGVGRGGQAARIELEDDELYDGMSTWYRLAYVEGGTRLQVFEHSPI